MAQLREELKRLTEAQVHLNAAISLIDQSAHNLQGPKTGELGRRASALSNSIKDGPRREIARLRRAVSQVKVGRV